MRCFLILFFICLVSASHRRYESNWADLDCRIAPRWYDEAKVGIFIHWGIYSVPGFRSEWLWYYWNDTKTREFMKNNYKPGFSYQEFAPMFTAELFNPDSWAQLFHESGAKYVVLTSKHHDGFSLYPSKRSFSWNSVDLGPKKDLVKEVSAAVVKTGMKFGVYHSLYEWFNPIYLEDKESGFLRQEYVSTKLWPDIKQLINDYKPSILWADGDWETYDTYWNSTDLIAWLYNDSPVKDEIVVNDRWGIGTGGKHGGFWNKNDRFNPGHLINHKWENAFTLDIASWGYRLNMKMEDVMTINELLYQLVSTVSCGGNVLINVGPTLQGTIPIIFQERLQTLGTWLKINGEAIYESSPWHHQNDSLNGDIWYTCRKVEYNAENPTAVPRSIDTVTAIYAIILKWPSHNILKIKDIVPYLESGSYKVELLENTQFEDCNLTWEISNNAASIKLPDQFTLSSKNAWTLKFTPNKEEKLNETT